MRFFKTSNASRQYKAGGSVYIFEPVENIGGSWLGLLAVEDDSAASQLVAAKIPQITEITAEEHEGLKKKPLAPNPHFREQRPQQQTPQLPVVVPAAPVASTSTSKQPTAATGVELKAAVLDVPDELKLETGDKTRTAKRNK